MFPNTIAFIPDGNRRYAKKAGISCAEAYALGTKRAWDVIDWMKDYPKIKAGTFYTLSLENLSRNKIELNVLFRLFERELDRVKQKGIFEEQGIKLKFIGRLNGLPKRLQEKISAVEKHTSEFGGRQINLAIGYNGQAEIVDAAKRFAKDCEKGDAKVEGLDETKFSEYLYSTSRPDLIVRTGGTQRLSGFLTYQSAYSELYFSDKYWPEFEKEDLNAAILEFGERERRFGK